jgi:phosphoribosylanthranilate isomerase
VLNPFAVDLNSGVELSPGQKDMVRLAAAILEVQRYDYDSNN